MKKFLLFLPILIMSCSTLNNSGETYKKDNFLVIRDSIKIRTIHTHQVDELFCSWVDEHDVLFVDTIYKPKL